MLAVILTVSMFGFYFSLIDRSNAAEVSNRYDAMNNSASSATSNHEFRFNIQNSLDTVGWNESDGTTASDTVIITFDADFNLGTIDCGDIDILFEDADTSTSISANANGGSRGSRTNCPGSATTWGLFIEAGSDRLTIYTPTTVTTYVTTGTRMTVRIGSNATNQETGDEWVTNPAEAQAGTQTNTITGSFGGTGSILVVTLSGVEVSATVAETLTFTITGLPGIGHGGTGQMTGCDVSGSDTTDDEDGEPITTVTTTATSVPFSTITSGNVYQGCQRLAISTNAGGGYTISQRSNNPLQTTGGVQIPDATCDGGPDCTPYVARLWANNGAGFGVACVNSPTSNTCSGTGPLGVGAEGNPNFGTGIAGDNFVPFAAESQGFTSSTRFAVTSVAPWGEIHVKAKYRLQISGLQGAGVYTNIVSWIATPTF